MAPNSLAVSKFSLYDFMYMSVKVGKINKGHTYIDVLRVIITYTEFFVNELFYVH